MSYLTTFACPFGRYQYKCLLFGAVPVGNMFQCKIDKIFNDMPNVFGIADNILVIGDEKDGADHDEAVYTVLRQYQDVNLKLKKKQVSFQVYINTILWQSSVKGRCPTRSAKSQSTGQNACVKEQKGAASLLRHS